MMKYSEYWKVQERKLQATTLPLKEKDSTDEIYKKVKHLKDVLLHEVDAAEKTQERVGRTIDEINTISMNLYGRGPNANQDEIKEFIRSFSRENHLNLESLLASPSVDSDDSSSAPTCSDSQGGKKRPYTDTVDPPTKKQKTLLQEE